MQIVEIYLISIWKKLLTDWMQEYLRIHIGLKIWKRMNMDVNISKIYSLNTNMEQVMLKSEKEQRV